MLCRGVRRLTAADSISTICTSLRRRSPGSGGGGGGGGVNGWTGWPGHCLGSPLWDSQTSLRRSTAPLRGVIKKVGHVVSAAPGGNTAEHSASGRRDSQFEKKRRKVTSWPSERFAMRNWFLKNWIDFHVLSYSSLKCGRCSRKDSTWTLNQPFSGLAAEIVKPTKRF